MFALGHRLEQVVARGVFSFLHGPRLRAVLHARMYTVAMGSVACYSISILYPYFTWQDSFEEIELPLESLK